MFISENDGILNGMFPCTKTTSFCMTKFLLPCVCHRFCESWSPKINDNVNLQKKGKLSKWDRNSILFKIPSNNMCHKWNRKIEMEMDYYVQKKTGA